MIKMKKMEFMRNQITLKINLEKKKNNDQKFQNLFYKYYYINKIFTF